MTKHTPGPWVAVWNEENHRTHIGRWLVMETEGGYSIGPAIAVSARCTKEKPTPLANARLIAAAPELLAALSDIFNESHPRADYVGQKSTHYVVPKAFVDAARAAIAKATGEASGKP